MAKTKKVLSTGRFGARYGVGIRKRLLKTELKQRKKHVCPICGFEKLRRISTGLYYCKKCEREFSGGAYMPETMTGRIIKKMVAQKKFLPQLGELIEAREKQFEAQEAIETKEEKKEDTAFEKSSGAKAEAFWKSSGAKAEAFWKSSGAKKEKKETEFRKDREKKRKELREKQEKKRAKKKSEKEKKKDKGIFKSVMSKLKKDEKKGVKAK